MFVVVENAVFQRYLVPDSDYVTPAGVTVPGQSLRQMPEAERNAIGVFTLHDGNRPDDADFNVVEGTPALVGGVWARQYTSFAKDPAAYKDSFKRDVDTAAENERLKYITPGSGQAAVYLRKEAESSSCLATYSAGSPPPLGEYPLLDASVGIEVKDPVTGAVCVDTYEVAQVVAAIAQIWTMVAAQIEAKRLGAKRAIDAATTMAELRAAATVDWTLS